MKRTAKVPCVLTNAMDYKGQKTKQDKTLGSIVRFNSAPQNVPLGTKVVIMHRDHQAPIITYTCSKARASVLPVIKLTGVGWWPLNFVWLVPNDL